MGSIGFGNPGSDLLPNPIDHQPRRHSNQHLGGKTHVWNRNDPQINITCMIKCRIVNYKWIGWCEEACGCKNWELSDEELVCVSAADGQRAHVHLRRLRRATRRGAVHGGAATGRPRAGQPPRPRLGRNHRHPRDASLHTPLFVKPHVTSQHRRRTGSQPPPFIHSFIHSRHCWYHLPLLGELLVFNIVWVGGGGGARSSWARFAGIVINHRRGNESLLEAAGKDQEMGRWWIGFK